MKAILLVRISSDSQQLDEQTNNLIDYAKSEGFEDNNLIIIEDVESGIKLSEDQRNGLTVMKRYITSDPLITTVYVWELSRLTRIPTTAYSLREFFIQNKIQLKCYSPNFQLLSTDRLSICDNGSLLFALYIQMAESEMRNKKARFKRSKIRNARTGKYSGGFIKFGYNVDEKGYYQIKEDEAELIRYIFARYKKGISILKLNIELMERGLTNSESFVGETLKCEAYTGLSNKYGMQRVYPQIISKEEFEECLEIKRKNNKRLDKSLEVYFGKRLIKCSHCGSHYVAMKTSIQYLCYNKFSKESKYNPKLKCTESPTININILDTILFEACIIEETYFRMDNRKSVLKELREQIKINEEKITAYKGKSLKTAVKKERNNDMYMLGNIDKEKYLINNKLILKQDSEFTNKIIEIETLNTHLKNRIHLEKREKVNIQKEYEKLEKDVYSTKDLIDKQEIIQRHIREVTISVKNEWSNFENSDEHIIPNTKIVNVYFYSNPTPLQYRVHYKKKPQQIEINETFYTEDNDELYMPQWVDVDFKIEKRFIRK